VVHDKKLTKELFMPLKEPEREFRSSRKHFKTLSLDESRSPDFDLFSDQEEYSEEEVAETMAKTIEQYMRKTLADYESGVARLKIEDKDNFELKGQFLKGLCTNTFSGSNHEDANKHIEKVLEIVDLFHIPNITIYQVMLRAFPMSLTGAATIQAQLNNLGREIKKVNEKVYAAQVGCEQCKGPHYTKDCPLKEEGKTLKEAYYTQFGAPFQGRGYRATEKRHEENSNLIKEIRASTDAAIWNQGASIKTLEIQIGQMSKVLQERGFGSLPSSTETNLMDHVKSISTIVEADSYPIRRIPYGILPIRQKKGPYGPHGPQNSGSFTLPCFINNVCFDNALADLGSSVSVMPLSTYLNLGLGELSHTKLTVELADRTVKYPKGIVENMLVGIGKFVFPVDFIILDMPEDIKVLLILERPFFSTDHVKIDVFKRKITLRVGEERIIFKSVKPASSLIKRVYMLGLRERMDLILKVANKWRLWRDKVDDLKPTIEKCEVVEEFRARNDARMGQIDFAVLEDMDACHDEGMGDVIFGEPFLREVGIKARRFDEMITIYNGNESVTYQMVRSHPRFKHHTNEQCNKIPPLLKVSEKDKMNGILHSYQKLKSFYKGVLNLGPEYVQDAEMEEWLTRRDT
ncbi:hypothetical protein Tco_1409164, partial [Tanacetum coccineum]